MAEEQLPDINFRVTLRNSINPAEVVSFAATPDLIETRNVNYKMVDPVHAPGQIAAYANSSSRSFNISNIRLISRTPAEAEENLRRLWILRSWTVPDFGKSSLTSGHRDVRNQAQSKGTEKERRDYLENNDAGVETRGQPPAVLLLSAYSQDSASGSFGNDKSVTNSKIGHINRVPVVLQNLSIPYPADIDYIPSLSSNIPMPTIQTLDMVLLETHSPREYENFSLTDYRNGILSGY